MATPYQETPEETNARPGYHLHPRQVEAAQLLGLLPGGPRAGLPPVEEMLFGGQSGGSKASALDTRIMTPYGERQMADIAVGERVCNPDGTATLVLAVHPQPRQQLYRVFFSDGGSTRVTADHLWLAKVSGWRLKADRVYLHDDQPVAGRLMTTAMLRQHIIAKAEEAPGFRHWPLIPFTQPVTFTPGQGRSPDPRPIDPYVLGVLLGDGTFRGGTPAFYSADPEIVEEVRWRIDGKLTSHPKADQQGGSWHIVQSAIKQHLITLKLWGHRSETKFVPRMYKYASVEDRRALLQGLMDTDGTADSRGHCAFASVSEELASDVCWLAQSLGAKATLTKNGPGAYRDSDGELVTCLPVFSVYLQSRNNADFFRLPRKKARCTGLYNGGVSALQRRMVAIEEDGFEEAKCIQVDHPNGLYLVDDFVVTHNTHTCRAVGVAICIQWPGVRVPIFRRKYVELNDSFVPWIQQEVRPPVAKYNRERHEMVFANGSVLMFRHCEYEHNVFDYLTAEWGGLIIDQAEQFTPFMVSFLRHRVRQPVQMRDIEGKPWRPIILYTANPGGPGHEYFRAGFVDVRLDGQGRQIMGQEGEGQIIEPGTVYQAPPKEGGQRRCYLPARLEDNPSLDKEEYERRLMGLPEHLRKAYMTGDWHVVAGAFFSEWRPLDDEGRPWHLWPLDTLRKHYHLPEDATFPPRDWVCWTATDGGFADPWCTLWLTRAPDKRLILYRERYGARIGIPDQARRIKEAEELTGERIVVRKADPAMFNRRANLTVSDAEVYAANGVYLERATNAREPGWRRVREVLSEVLDDGFPRLIVIDGRCPNLVRTLPAMLTDTRHHEDIADGQEDHASDVIRYLTMPALATPLERKQYNIATVRMRPQEIDYRLGITGLRSAW